MLQTLLSDHDPAIQEIARAARKLILSVRPEAHEQVETSWGGYLLFKQVEDAGNTVCFLSLHKKHVSLGFSQASELEDPARLLQGTGKHQRHVKLKSLAEVNCPELRALLTQAWDRQPEPAALQAALEKVRELCLAMPKTSEKLSHGHPTFYVGKRAFAVYGLYSPSLAVKPSASRGFDLADDPRFFPTPYMAKNGWWSLRLEEPIEWEQVRELLEESYREFKKA